jgi:two-component system nitrogen regulation sensor histidine kinase NtrY
MTRRRISHPFSTLSVKERKKRKREITLIVLIIVVVTVLTFVETKIIRFGTEFPISNTTLMFILININLLLFLLLAFLVLRNLVKLLYDRKRKVTGAKLRTRLVLAFITLTLIPTIVLFIFSINFITTSIEFWFSVPVEQALEKSLSVGRRLYDHIEENNQFFLKRISYQVKKKKLLQSKKKDAVSRYFQVVQSAFNFNAIEIYSVNSKRLAITQSPKFKDIRLKTISADNLRKERNSNGVLTITEIIPSGELIRTIGTIPFEKKGKNIEGFLVLSVLLPLGLSNDLASISKGFEEYQQIKLLKKPIQVTYYITLSIVALLVMFCAIWFGFYQAKAITIPIMELVEGTRKVAEGDLGFHIGLAADDEIGSLVDSFNQMTRDLRSGREQLEQSAQTLRGQNIEIEEKRQYMEIVLRNVSAGVITLDAHGFINTINKSAEKMLNISHSKIVGTFYKDLLNKTHLKLAQEIIESLNATQNDAVALPLRTTVGGRPRSFLIHINALKDDTGNHMGLVMVFDDLTELEKAQRMAAWREVARRIAHEVKNPLTPVTLSAQRLRRKFSDTLRDPVFEECTRTIIDHVDLIRNLVNEFSTFARFPDANPKPCMLIPIIEETIGLYKDGYEKVNFDLILKDNIPQMNLDRQQIKQAMINLMDNAISAIKEKGNIQITLTHDPILKRVRIEVADDGTGILDEDKTRLFEPNFSTKKSGMGLGLTIVSTIIDDHNGRINVQDNSPKGAKFVIELPVV